MSALYNMVFLLQFLVMLGIVGSSVYNTLKAGELYGWRGMVMSFVGMLVTFIVGMITFLQEPTEYLFMHLLRLETMALGLGAVLFFVQLLLVLKDTVKDPIKAYAPEREDNA